MPCSYQLKVLSFTHNFVFFIVGSKTNMKQNIWRKDYFRLLTVHYYFYFSYKSVNCYSYNPVSISLSLSVAFCYYVLLHNNSLNKLYLKIFDKLK